MRFSATVQQSTGFVSNVFKSFMNGEEKRLSFYLSKPHCSTILYTYDRDIHVRQSQQWPVSKSIIFATTQKCVAILPFFLAFLCVHPSSFLLHIFTPPSASLESSLYMFFCHIHFCIHSLRFIWYQRRIFEVCILCAPHDTFRCKVQQSYSNFDVSDCN